MNFIILIPIRIRSKDTGSVISATGIFTDFEYFILFYVFVFHDAY